MTAAVKEIRASTWSGLATVLTFSIHVSGALRCCGPEAGGW